MGTLGRAFRVRAIEPVKLGPTKLGIEFGQRSRRSRQGMTFGGKISGGFSRTQKGGQPTEQRLHFRGIEHRRFHLQHRAAQRHKRRIGFNQALQVRGSDDFSFDLIGDPASDYVGDVTSRFVGFSTCNSIFGGIHCHLIASCYCGLRSTFAGCSERTLP